MRIDRGEDSSTFSTSTYAKIEVNGDNLFVCLHDNELLVCATRFYPTNISGATYIKSTYEQRVEVEKVATRYSCG